MGDENGVDVAELQPRRGQTRFKLFDAKAAINQKSSCAASSARDFNDRGIPRAAAAQTFKSQRSILLPQPALLTGKTKPTGVMVDA